MNEVPSVVISSRPDPDLQKMGVSTLLQIDSPDPALRDTPGQNTAPTVTHEHVSGRDHMLPGSEQTGRGQALGSPPVGKQKN